MRQERLSGIGLLNIEKDFEINIVQIVTDFVAKSFYNFSAHFQQQFFFVYCIRTLEKNK
jgi:hypothetical protein